MMVEGDNKAKVAIILLALFMKQKKTETNFILNVHIFCCVIYDWWIDL